MKKAKVLIIILLTFLFFSFEFGDKNPHGSKTNHANKKIINKIHSLYKITGDLIYTDSLNGANDTSSLISRGYLVYNRGTNIPGIAPSWFQGNPAEFPAYEGPSNGYVASNFNSVTGTSNIDNWLVFPIISPKGIYRNDSLFFYSRSEDGSIFPDSIRVMYSTTDSVPEGNWTELGRFKVSTTGWELNTFAAPDPSPIGRFAIRYAVTDGGPGGQNSDYIGIDFINITSNGSIGIGKNEIVVKYELSQNYPNPFNPVTVIQYEISVCHSCESRNPFVTLKVYDVIGREVETLVNEKQNPGSYEVRFNGSNLSSGVYFYKLEAGDFTSIRKMLLIK